jgi:hypothetical protein
MPVDAQHVRALGDAHDAHDVEFGVKHWAEQEETKKSVSLKD